MASTHSPTRRRLTSPMRTVGRPAASILTTATSVRRSAPTMRALNSRRSGSVTMTSSAPSTTWALVMMKPSALTMKPEPTPRWRGSSAPGAGGRRGSGRPGSGMPKRRRNSSISGSISGGWPRGAARPRSSVRMLTTAGPTRSTRSAKSGSATVGLACAAAGVTPPAASISASAAAASQALPDCIRDIVFIPLSMGMACPSAGTSRADTAAPGFNAGATARRQSARRWPSVRRPSP